MLSGVMLLWFLLTAMAVIFVAWDIQSTPESPVLKAGFVLLTCYTGPFGAFLYVLGCREPLPGLHEQYIAVCWRQVVAERRVGYMVAEVPPILPLTRGSKRDFYKCNRESASLASLLPPSAAF